MVPGPRIRGTSSHRPAFGSHQKGAAKLLTAEPTWNSRIELRAPSAPSARLAENARIYRRRPDARLKPTVLSSAFGARRVLAYGDPAESARPD